MRTQAQLLALIGAVPAESIYGPGGRSPTPQPPPEPPMATWRAFDGGARQPWIPPRDPGRDHNELITAIAKKQVVSRDSRGYWWSG